MTNEIAKNSIKDTWDDIKNSFQPNGNPNYEAINNLVNDYFLEKILVKEFKSKLYDLYSSMTEQEAQYIQPLLNAAGLHDLKESVGNPDFPEGITNSDSLGISFLSLKNSINNKVASLKDTKLTAQTAADEIFSLISEHVRNEDVIATDPETKANLVDDKGSLKAAFNSFIVKKLQDGFGSLSLNAGSTLTDLANAIVTILDTSLGSPHLDSTQILTYLQNSKLDKGSEFSPDIAKKIDDIALASDDATNSNVARADDLASKLVTAIKSGVILTDDDTNSFSSMEAHISEKIQLLLDDKDNYLYRIGLNTITGYENDGSFDNFAKVISAALDTDDPASTKTAVKDGLNSQELGTEITTPLIEALEGKDIANAIATAITGVLDHLGNNQNVQNDIEARALENVRDLLVTKTLTTGKDISEFADEIKDAINSKSTGNSITTQDLETDLENADLTQLKDNIKAVADTDYDVDQSEVVPPNQYSANYDDYKVTTFISDLQAATGYSDVARDYTATITGKTLLQVFERESVLFEHNRIKDALKLAFKNSQTNKANVANQIVLAGLTDWSASHVNDASALNLLIRAALPSGSNSLNNIISAISSDLFIEEINTLDDLGTKLKEALCTTNCLTLEVDLQKALRGDAIIATQSHLGTELERMTANTFANLAEALTESMLSLSTITEIKNDDTANPQIVDFNNFRDKFFKADLEKQNVKLIKADLLTTLNSLVHTPTVSDTQLSAENIAKAIVTKIGATSPNESTDEIKAAINNYDYATITTDLKDVLSGKTTIEGIADALSGYLADFRTVNDSDELVTSDDYQKAIRYKVIDIIKTKVATITADGKSFADGFGTFFPALATILDAEWIKSDWRDGCILELLKSALNKTNMKVSEFGDSFNSVVAIDETNKLLLQTLVEKVQAQILANRLTGLSGSTTDALAESFYNKIAPVGISYGDEEANIKSDFAAVSVKSSVSAINTALNSADATSTSLAAKIVDSITTLDSFDKATLKTLLANYLRTEEAYDDTTTIVDAIGDLTGIANLGHSSVAAALFSALKIGNTPKNFFGCTGTENSDMEFENMQKSEAPLASHDGTLSSVIKAFVDCIRWATTNEITTNYLYHNGTACVNSLSSDTEALGVCISGINPFEPPMLQL